MANEETYNEFSGEEVHHHYHPQGPKRHHYPVHHTRIPADHLESHGNSRLWNDPDYGPIDAEATVPGLSAIGRGPKGDSISATVTSDDDSFVITIYDTDTGEVIGESSNLSAGYITAHQASVTPQPGKATTAYIDVHRGGEVHSYEIKINPGAPGTRIFILPDGVKQRSNRPAETTYACESEELQVYNMPKFKNAPAPRPGDLVMCILEFLDGSYALAIGTVMSNDHHRVIFLVRTILPTRTPHIESVDGTDWWFIGDVNTNVPATAGDIRDITIEMIGDEEEPYAYAEKNSDHTVSLYFFIPKSHEYKAGENLELEDYTFDIKEEYTNSVLAQALEAAGNLYSGGDGISIDSDHVVSADETLARSDDVNAAITEASDKLQSEIDDLQNTVDTLEDKDTTYTAGDYIEITGEENAISAELAVKAANEYTDTKAEELQEEIENFNPGEPGIIYTAGDMIDITDNVISIDKTALRNFLQLFLWDMHYKIAYIEWNDSFDYSFDGDLTDDRPEEVIFTITNKETGIVIYKAKLTAKNNWSDTFVWTLDDDKYEFSFEDVEHYRCETEIKGSNIALVAMYIFDHYYVGDVYGEIGHAFSWFGSNYSESDLPANYSSIYEVDLTTTGWPSWIPDNEEDLHTESATIFDTFKTAQPRSLNEWFYKMDCASIANLEYLDTSQVISMKETFYHCKALTELDVSNWDTSNITDMQSIFQNCSSLKTLDVSNWDTSNVTDMQSMFSGCSALTTIYSNDSKFVTTAVTISMDMFYNCSSLIGGNGTKYSSSYSDKSYAHVDTTNNPGYFTEALDN